MYVIIEIVYFFLVLPMKSLHVKFCYGSGKKYQWCQNPLGEMLGNGKVRESQRECKMLQLARKMEREEWGEAAKDRNLGKIYAYIEGIKENQDGKEIRRKQYYRCQASQVVLVVKNLPANAGDARDTGSILGSGRSPGVGNGTPLQYSCLENSIGRGAWWATVYGATKSATTDVICPSKNF